MAQDPMLALFTILIIATFAVASCLRLGLSPILGYLATGVLSGSGGLALLPEGESLHHFAELGVVLLMFTIGLEFSLPRLLAMKRLVFVLGGAQVALGAGGFALVGLCLGLTPEQASVVGGALAMSSTAIVLKFLGERGELGTPHGHAVTGVLLFQDIATVPLLVVLPVLAGDGTGKGGELVMALLRAALVFLALVFAGRRLLPSLLRRVAGIRSLELFMLTALTLVIAAAGLSRLAGLAPTLGAFMAGMLLGETPFRHQVEADIRPFRDLMLGLFFITVGMQLDPRVYATSTGGVLLVLLALVPIKALSIRPLVARLGYASVDAWRAAIALAQGGEFGLLLVSTALGLGLLTRDIAQPLLGGLVLSMALAPLLLRFEQRLGRWLASETTSRPHDDIEGVADRCVDHRDHIIICGFGRLGQNLLGILMEEGIDAVALDLDPDRVCQARAIGRAVFYGDATRVDVLRAAGIERARALAISVEDGATATRIARQARALRDEIPILARSAHGRGDEALLEAGAEVFAEALEASLAFAGQLLVMLDVPPERVEARLNEIRAQEYAPLRLFFHDSDERRGDSEALDYPERIRALVVSDGSGLVGRTLREVAHAMPDLDLLEVRRGALRVSSRSSSFRLRAGDVLMLKGQRDALEHVEERLDQSFHSAAEPR